jgi:hypothetical protein
MEGVETLAAGLEGVETLAAGLEGVMLVLVIKLSHQICLSCHHPAFLSLMGTTYINPLSYPQNPLGRRHTLCLGQILNRPLKILK